MPLQAKVTLKGEHEKMFNQIKHKLALTTDAELLRKLIIEEYRRQFPKQKKEADLIQ